jgi:cysteine-rich repeat protein
MPRLGLTLWPAASLVLAAAGAPALAAPGDTCATATEIAALPFTSSGTTCGAGDDFDNDVGGAAVCSDLPRGYGGEDVFFKLTLERGNQVAFDLALPAGATGDLALFLVRAPSCADPQVCVGNSVDLIGAGVGPERIKANAQAYPSGTYYLIVDSKLSAPDPASCGAYALTVTGHLSAFCGNGAIDPGELCDDGNNNDGDCCASDCQSKAPGGTLCRAAVGPCDVAETCNADGTCPANGVKPAGTTCRPAAGSCDAPELCDGLRATCGTDRFLVAGTVCRPAQAVCDQTELCTGNGPDCPADGLKPAGTPCGAAGVCQKAPTCNGSGTCLPGGPVSCDDNNSCTADSCHPFFGCLHAPICMDAGADAGGIDATQDTGSPDSPAADLAPPPADTGVPDMDKPSLLPDAPLPADATPPRSDLAADSPPPLRLDGAPPMPDSGGPLGDGPLPVADSLGDTLDDGSRRVELDGSPVVAQDAGVGGKSPILSPDGGMSLLPGKGGCSCHLGARGGRDSDGPAALLAVALMALVALRRRTS